MASMALESKFGGGVRVAIGLAAFLCYGWVVFNAAPADEGGKPKPAEAKTASTDEEFLRRVYLDLTGQLPSREDMAKFLADKDPHKREKLIDKLLNKEAGSLEDLLSQALKNNPDIRVAETKLHEAEAELNRARLQVMQKIVALKHSLEVQQNSVKASEARWKRVNELYKAATITATVVQEAEQELIREKAKLTALEGELPYLLGKSSTKTANQAAIDRAMLWLWQHQLDDKKTARWLDDSSSNRELMYLFWTKYLNLPAQSPPPPSGTMAQKIRKGLDQPVQLDYKDKPAWQILEDLLKKIEGVPFRNLATTNLAEKIDVQFKDPLPLAAALQAVQDLSFNPDIRFVIREYGILVTHRKNLPEGAVLLFDFWKAVPRGDGTSKTPPTPGAAPQR